jgi:hypothetical protein
MWGQAPPAVRRAQPGALTAKVQSTSQHHAARPGLAFFELPAFTASSRMRVTRAVSSTRSLENFAPSPAITEPAASANRNASA